MASYSYIDTGGKMQTIEAANPQAALSSAPNIMKGSGVMAAPSPTVTQAPVNPAAPVSSATYMQNQQVNQAVNNAINPPQPKPLSAQQQRVKDFLGTDDDSYITSLGMSDLLAIDKEANARQVQNDSYKKAEDQLQNSYNAELAAQNAQYAQLSSQLAKSRQGDVEKAKTTAAQLNPYSGANTDENNYMTAVNTKYDQLQADLDLKAQQARSALAAGNSKEYAAIQESMARSYQQGTDSIQEILGNLEKTKLQKEQFNLSQKREDRILDSAEKKQFLTDVETFSGSPVVDRDLQTFSETGELSTGIKSFIKQGVQAGYTPSEVLSYLEMGTQKQRNQEQLVYDREAKNALAQERLMLAIANSGKESNSTISFSNDALQTILDNTIVGLNITNKDQTNRIANTYANAYKKDGLEGLQNEIIGYASKRGDAPSKQDLVASRKLVAQLDEIQEIRDTLKQKGVSTGITNGSIEQLFNYVGKTSDPSLAEMRAKTDRLNNDLVLKYAATTFTDKIYDTISRQNPSIKKGDKLNAVQERALRDSIERDLKVQLEPLVGDYYDDIFKSKSTSGSPVTTGGYVPSGEAAEILKRRGIK